MCPRERPPFSALNFRSGAYHFHKLPKNPFRSLTILHFWANFAVPETIIFKISLISTRSSPPTAGSARKRSAAPRVSGRSGDSAFSHSRRIKLVPEPRIFTLKTAQARSGAPHFHAQNGSSSFRSPAFSSSNGSSSFRSPTFSRSTGSSFRSPCQCVILAAAHTMYLPKFGVSTPPPPSPGEWADEQVVHIVCSSPQSQAVGPSSCPHFCMRTLHSLQRPYSLRS